MMNKWRVTKRKRRGAASLEFAILILWLLVTILAMIEFGRAMMVRQILVNATREAARRAAVPGASDLDIANILSTYESGGHMSGTWTPTTYVNGVANAGLSSANSHDEITIAVQVNYEDVSWGIMRYLSSGTTLGSQTVIRKE